MTSNVFRIWVWIVIYSICYFLFGLVSFIFVGTIFVMTGEAVGPENFFLPFPLRRCAFFIGKPIICYWNFGYSVMSISTYLLFLKIFVGFAKRKELSPVVKTLFLGIFVVLPFLLSIPARLVVEFLTSVIYRALFI